jgi:hypothetical protein
MTRPIELYQGESKTIVVETNIDLSAYAEIEFSINTPTQILKKLSEGDIADVTATQFSVAIEPADTESVASGEYQYQCRATDSSGNITQGKFTPDKIKIRDSIFVRSLVGGNDYGEQ